MGDERGDGGRLWRVTVTVSGAAMETKLVRGALQRLSEERPFLNSMRYGVDRAEICYWDQAATALDAGSLALRIWDDHRVSANLPPWQVVALEVTERTVHRERGTQDRGRDLRVLPLPL